MQARYWASLWRFLHRRWINSILKFRRLLTNRLAVLQRPHRLNRDVSRIVPFLMDAAEGLAILARRGKLDLNDEGRQRAAVLASVVQTADQPIMPSR